MQFRKELDSYNNYLRNVRAINSDQSLNSTQRKRSLRSLVKPTRNPVTNCSAWWARDNWRVDSFHLNKLADIAVGRIDGFDKGQVRNYPEFKNPSVNFDVGENLCKLGFPFHSIVPHYDKASNYFQLPDGALPIPLFPIEGIFTRTAIMNDGPSSVKFVETSSPGLRGQSGGPTFDTKGRIWAMQSRTVHHPLGFDPEVPNQRSREHQFLNSGMGTHASTIIDFLKAWNVDVCVSAD